MATIGEELRRERSRRGLSIRDIEQILHIRGAYLEALEEDNYNLIPGDVYVKGFIRNYANFLGLSGHDMVNAYKNAIGEEIVLPVRPLTTRKKARHAKEKEFEVQRRLSVEGRAQRRKKVLRREQFMVVIFLIFFLLFLLWLFIS